MKKTMMLVLAMVLAMATQVFAREGGLTASEERGVQMLRMEQLVSAHIKKVDNDRRIELEKTQAAKQAVSSLEKAIALLESGKKKEANAELANCEEFAEQAGIVVLPDGFAQLKAEASDGMIIPVKRQAMAK